MPADYRLSRAQSTAIRAFAVETIRETTKRTGERPHYSDIVKAIRRNFKNVTEQQCKDILYKTSRISYEKGYLKV